MVQQVDPSKKEMSAERTRIRFLCPFFTTSLYTPLTESLRFGVLCCMCDVLSWQHAVCAWAQTL